MRSIEARRGVLKSAEVFAGILGCDNTPPRTDGGRFEFADSHLVACHLEISTSKWFGERVGKLLIERDIFDDDILPLNCFSDQVLVWLQLLAFCVKLGIGSNGKGSVVVAIEDNQVC